MDEIEFVADKRTELISIILALSECNEYAKEHFYLSLNEEYTHRVLNHFKRFKNHNAVALAKQIGELDMGFNYDNPIRLAFELNSKLQYNETLSSYLLTELEEIDLIKKFMREVDSFAIDTNFNNFFISNIEYYNTKIRQLENIIKSQSLYTCMQDFFKGNIKKSFCINVIPSLINSNHGFEVDNKIYANIGLLCENLKTISDFDNGYLSIVIHEFMHSFVNENTAKHINSINFNLQQEHLSQLRQLGYGNKRSYINDCIVRVLTIRLTEKMKTIDTSKFLQKEIEWGFIHIKKVYEQILKYENQNLSWEDYYINILDVFQQPLTKNKDL